MERKTIEIDQTVFDPFAEDDTSCDYYCLVVTDREAFNIIHRLLNQIQDKNRTNGECQFELFGKATELKD
jgi:hypothetical protein